MRDVDRLADLTGTASADRGWGGLPLVAVVVDRLPSTYSITRYGTPSSVVPPSISRAMLRMLERREDPPLGAEAIDAVGGEHAAQELDRHLLLEVRAFALGARKTAPMPPCPSSRTTR